MFADVNFWLVFLCWQTWAKWLRRPHFLHDCPYAGQSPRLCLPPQYRQRFIRLSLLGLSLSVLLGVTALISSSVLDTGVLFLSSFRRILVVSLLLPISIAHERLSFFSCSSFLRIDSFLTPRTSWSQMRESCRQLQKLHVWASFRNTVTYLSWSQRLKMNLS